MPLRPLFAVAVVALTAGIAAAQPDAASALVGEEKRTVEELDAARKLAGERRFDDALRRYQQILSESGDLFVPLDGRRSVPARWVVHQHIATLDPAGLKLYREQADIPARKWLDQGAADRDPKALERVVADAFGSRPAEAALQLLGDLALERGEFEAAERYYRLLARPASLEAPEKGKFELVYPDPSDGGALARAKQILALLFQGLGDAAKIELAAYRKTHPTAAGPLAGRTGPYADTLQQLLESQAQLAPPAPPVRERPWLTFAGDAARNGRIPTEATPYWPPSPAWRTPLPGDPTGKPHRDTDPPAGTGAAARSLAFHPAIVPGFALVADAARVTAYRLLTGQLAARYSHGEKNRMPDTIDLRVPSRTDARYTLSVTENRVYARLGAQPMKPPADGKPQEGDSAIVCLGLERTGPDLKLSFRWQLRARVVDTDPAALFEGTPVVRDGRLLAAHTRFDGRQAITAIHCYDADAADGRAEPPLPRWKQDVWSAEMGPADSARTRHDLLTVAGPFVVYCTHSGAVIALDAATGRRAWAYRYPSVAARPMDGILPRDLAPCLFANGRVYVAPADGDRIFCLDAMTGEPVWESSPVHVVQLLGVSRGRLFATLGGYPKGVRCYHAATGAHAWTRPDEGDLATYGRGFLTDRWLLWPTRTGLHVLQQDDGEPLAVHFGGELAGNLAFGEGCLVVATATELLGYVPDRLRLGQWQAETSRDPVARYRLALGLVEAGREKEAIAEFQRLEAATEDDFFHGVSIRDQARRRQHELLLAEGKISEALAERFAPSDRVRAAVLRRSEIPALLGQPAFRDVWVTRADGVPLRADDYLASLLDPAGRAALDERVKSRLATDFDAVVRDTPWPPGVRAALRQRAERHEQAGEPWEAARRYRQLLHAARWDGDADRQAVRAALVRIYDKHGYRTAAPDLPAATTPAAPASLEPAWTAALDPFREWPLTPMGETPFAADEEGRVFFSTGRQIICRALATGKPLWTADVGHDAHTFGLHAETALIAGRLGVSCVRRADGLILWRFLAADPTPIATTPQPRVLIPETRPVPFSGFRLAGPRLFLRRGDDRLFALDVETGDVQWQLVAPGAPLRDIAFHDPYLATADRVLVQTTAGQLLGVDAGSGRVVYRRAAPAPWRTAPVAVDSQQAIVSTDGEHLQRLDLMTGRVVWEQSFSGWPSLAGSAPQLRRDGSHLLVVVERNYGWELERRDIGTGTVGWRVRLGRDPVDVAAIGIAVGAYVVPAGDTVRAYDPETGKRLEWEHKLPQPGPWRTQAVGSAVLLYPATALPLTDVPAAEARAWRELAGVPTLERFHTAAAILYHAWMRRTFPVRLLDAKDGRELSRRDTPAAGPRAAVLFGPRHAAIAVDGALLGLPDRNQED